jgi:hypothetical protein
VAECRIGPTILRSRICNIILNAPTEDECDDTKDCFYEGLESVFVQLPKHHMEIFVGGWNALNRN